MKKRRGENDSTREQKERKDEGTLEKEKIRNKLCR
jgi:hypothetical protein